MKVAHNARREFDEWQEESCNAAQEAEAEALAMALDAEETFKRDSEREKSDLLVEISNTANCEGWTADKWRDTLLATYMFSEDELSREYHWRETDDLLGDPFDDPIYLESYSSTISRIHDIAPI